MNIKGFWHWLPRVLTGPEAEILIGCIFLVAGIVGTEILIHEAIQSGWIISTVFALPLIPIGLLVLLHGYYRGKVK